MLHSHAFLPLPRTHTHTANTNYKLLGKHLASFFGFSNLSKFTKSYFESHKKRVKVIRFTNCGELFVIVFRDNLQSKLDSDSKICLHTSRVNKQSQLPSFCFNYWQILKRKKHKKNNGERLAPPTKFIKHRCDRCAGQKARQPGNSYRCVIHTIKKNIYIYVLLSYQKFSRAKCMYEKEKVD